MLLNLEGVPIIMVPQVKLSHYYFNLEVGGPIYVTCHIKTISKLKIYHNYFGIRR